MFKHWCFALLVYIMVSIFVDGEWFHRVDLPYIGHPRDTKRRYSLISHLEEWWDSANCCWTDDFGSQDFCANRSAVWRETSDELGTPEPLFWTRWPRTWVCPESWWSKSQGPNGCVIRDAPETPEWVESCQSEVPFYFLWDMMSRKKRAAMTDLSSQDRKRVLELFMS